MRRLSILMSILVIGLFAAGGLFGDDTTPTKVKGHLPPNWSKLGLSDDQKQSLYDIQAKFQAQRADLQKQLRALRKQERTAMYGVLTAAQKARLKEIVAEKAGSETEPKKEDKKPSGRPDPSKKP